MNTTHHARALLIYMGTLILASLAAAIIAASGGHPLSSACTTDTECEALHGTS